MRCEAVGKRYGRGRWILRDVDMDVCPGDVLAVVGDNGSGKSTLLRILAGSSRPTSGTVSGRSPHTGYVPDRFTADDRMSALSYLGHMGRIRGLSSAAAHDRANLLIDRLALAGGPEAPLRTLSKGNAQKVALAQALLVEPDLLVLDEPWSGLDTAAHAVLGDVIGEVAARGGAVVFTDHRESVTEAHATGTYLISDGRVTWRGGPEAAGDPVTVRLVLRAPAGGAAPAEQDWYAVPGVVDAARRGPEIVLRVRREHSDAVLLTALRHRWSVERLERITDGRRAFGAGARRAAG
ncbi:MULTISPECIES: ATP-binding cassette domain-containing protein [unclassified Streptomyces]|uniref:ATP-binding cassette domain-containing protein n=1 Tax=unclassified Streptomyces TaxID=2593676 RepID=UPI000B807DEA|nr:MULTISPECIES: ABC transporter ATP-binding protein [unclassified Streptomyces]MYS23336.1 ATP-binding cassette domain-containing protein [Streptomyces sp. SID4948]